VPADGFAERGKGGGESVGGRDFDCGSTWDVS
jgi:hypothetical protein